MAEMKIICVNCGQHILCDDQWTGQQIQCPACQNHLIVPPSEPVATSASLPAKPVTSPSAPPSRHRLSPGVTQVTRRHAPAPIQRKGAPPRRAKSGNLAGYIALVVALAVGAWAAYTYLPGLIKEVQDTGTSKAPANSTSAGGGGGPLGEVNAAMDVSDTLDGGSAPSRPRVDAAKRLVTGQPSAQPVKATNAVPKSPRPR